MKRPNPNKDKSHKFVVTDVKESKHWPAWKGTSTQTRIDIRLGHGLKARYYHLFVPSDDPLATAKKGGGVTIQLHHHHRPTQGE